MLKKYDGLLNLDATIASSLFERVEHPWEVLPLIKNFILETIPTLGSEFRELGENVFVHESVKIANTAVINGPTIICKNADRLFLRNLYIKRTAVFALKYFLRNRKY